MKMQIMKLIVEIRLKIRLIMVIYVKKFIMSFMIKLKNNFALVISMVDRLYIVGIGKIKYTVRVGLGIIIHKVHMGVSRVKKVIGVGLEFIKEVVDVIIGYLKTLVKKVLNSIMLITLDKLFGLLLGAIFFASLKYAVSGCLSVN